jgi:putative selenium metabolism protein SsnA
LKGGKLVELEPASVEVADLRIDGGAIVARGPSLEPSPGDEVLDLVGKVVMPGLVCAHHHLYMALGCGAPPPSEAPQSYLDQLARGAWRLDQALDLDSSQVSATVGALEALSSGTTTLFDQHSSPKAIRGVLLRVAKGISEVGLRAVLSYEVTDRHGAMGREEGLEETINFMKKARGRFRGMIGAHASFTLSHDALEGIKEARNSVDAGIHIHLAEDPSDEKLSFERYGDVPVNRLMGAELLGPKTLIAHAVHLSWPELAQVISTGSWLIHNPRSNMNSQVGYAPAGRFGSRATLGSDGLSPDMFAEAQTAYFRAGQPIDILRYLANGHRVASQVFDARIGPLREGAVADLLILDYREPTPLTAENLAQHLFLRMSARFIEAVMVDGVWRLWGRRPLSVNAQSLAEQAREASAALWARIQQQPEI